MTVKIKKQTYKAGSENVYADLGFPDSDEMLVKAELVKRLENIIKRRSITQSAAAKIIGVSQPDLSKILKGNFRGYSIGRLMKFLTAFDRDVEIVIRRKRTKGKSGQVSVRAA